MVGSIFFNGLVVNHGFDHRFRQGFPANAPVNLSNDAWNCRKLPVKLMIKYSLFNSNDLLLIFRSSTKIKPRGKISHLDFLGSYQHGIPKGFQTDPSLHGAVGCFEPDKVWCLVTTPHLSLLKLRLVLDRLDFDKIHSKFQTHVFWSKQGRKTD